MRGFHAPSPAERLLAEIYEAGYTSVDDFIDRLRFRPRHAAPEPARHAAAIDPFTDTIELQLDIPDAADSLAGMTHWYPEFDADVEVDPSADTTEFPVVQHIWVAPERHAS
ncbi:hypothetical protein [Nocardia sp. NRRL WC-3656]|uniref:hypothetical protein n=1 Tax=Nocardia sp. NRRL WC-3656 TaxID=1463824 RepID=UPI0004C42BD9|nr:hypothetical protein [Nocardia sp. NRRL WC-3656]